ncbi:hypothetical protein V2A60_008960 [Cordyceps javanica]|uniref:gamma-glutamylcyclotransferase n=1 Tax=Cordyceps javanica TaxID=43265 RepID=A0A545UPI9_9HYPO|nr:AIG2-like family protein [Cordyceps javanica]TQW03192.1 AIG2-like family protein [Cordyceps javanica]
MTDNTQTTTYMEASDDSQQSQDSVLTVVEENRHEILYFAYGSNLSTAQMRARCPFSTAIGLGFLPGWRWIINERGFANVVAPSHPSYADADAAADEAVGGVGGGGVYGLLYLLPPRDEACLDVFEGVAPEGGSVGAYDKLQCDVRWVRDGDGKPVPDGGKAVRALVYVDERRARAGVPRQEYIGRMERGIEDAVRNWGMDEEYANRVMRKWWKST